jgi:hypothetical protein
MTFKRPPVSLSRFLDNPLTRRALNLFVSTLPAGAHIHHTILRRQFMNRFSLSRFPGVSRTLLAVFATGAVFTAGCANMATTATGSSSMDTGGSITGRIHGGNQPVAFATVNLWVTGEGVTAPSKVVSVTSGTDGSFAFFQDPASAPVAGTGHYVCPSSGALVYLVANKGNTIGTGDNTVQNDASVFLAALGPCNSVASTFVDMSEVTTVASMAALQQYFNPSTESFSSDGTGFTKNAISNAFALVPNMVDFSTGTAVTSKAIPAGSITVGYNYAGTSVTATPEANKINTIANILAACINNASSTAPNCTTLFNNAVPPAAAITARPSGSFPVATDVLQAVYYMLTNPTNLPNLTPPPPPAPQTNIATLANLSSASAPFQPSLGSAPSDWTIAISYSSSTSCNGGGSFIKNAQDLAVDTYGNIWIGNNESGGNLSQMSPAGVPMTCIGFGTVGGTGKITGVTIDSLGAPLNVSDVWVADSGSNNVFRYVPGQALTGITAYATASGKNPFAIAADGIGDIYFTSPTDTSLYEIPKATTTGVTPVSINSSIGTAPARMMVDPTSVWTTSGSSFVYRTASSTPNTGTGFTSTKFTTDSPSYGISLTAVPSGSTNNFVYVSAEGTSNTLAQLTGTGTSYAPNAAWPSVTAGTPASVASDGSQNVWAIDHANNALFAFGAAQQTISPTTGMLKSATYLGSGRSIIVDQSGNIWISLDNANSITEIVGAAVPVYQPVATALRSGYFQTIP